jgi:hypothetical protein
MARNKKPCPRCSFVITHIPQNLSWLFLVDLWSVADRSLRHFQIMRDVSKRDTPEGEWFILVKVKHAAARKAIESVLLEHKAVTRTVSHDESEDLIQRFTVHGQDLFSQFATDRAEVLGETSRAGAQRSLPAPTVDQEAVNSP